jgi:hypothetical protein
MEKKKFVAPFIDGLIHACKGYPDVGSNFYREKLVVIFNELLKIEVQGDDDYRSIWLPVECGSMEDFGDFEEFLESGEVSNRQDFEELWRYYYPDKLKWYNFSITQYAGVRYFYLDSKLVFQFKEKGISEQIYDFQSELIDWLIGVVSESMRMIIEDVYSYNEYISINLPYSKRTGRILRQDYWTVFPEDIEDFKHSITPDMVEILNEIKNRTEIDENSYLSAISSGDFFRFCEIGYDANHYFDFNKKLSSKEKYQAKADGRDCGLRKLDESSVAEFADWYTNERNCGGHPWEICRGGNSTHISLYVYHDDKGWYLWLEGSSRTRVVETILMAVALYKQNIPFILGKSEEIYKMARGIDYIGIVPETVSPRYCQSYFPTEDKIIDFMNLGRERVPELIQKSYWYPLTAVKLSGIH